MIEEFTKKWFERKDALQAKFEQSHADDYKQIVQWVCEMLTDDEYGAIDPNRVHEINDGDYQGTLVYVIGCTGYQPSKYWYVTVDYGSCSGCDTLEAIRNCFDDGKPSAEQVNDYMTLALHIVQGMKEIGSMYQL